MKLSQIRLLSWGAAAIGAILCLWYGFQAYKNITAMSPQEVQPVVFDEVSDTDDLTRQRMIEKNRLLSALHFLTKVDPPPVKEIQVVSAPVKTKDTPPPPPPPPPPFDPKVKLLLVSFDDIDGNHLAFVSCDNQPSHPYLKGEKLPSKPVTVIKEIFRQSILIETEDGKKQKQIYTENAIIQKVTRSNLVPPANNSRVVVPTTDGKSKTVSAVAKTRRVPRSRSVDINKAYGVSVVEYDPTPEGEARYAISEKDLKALENQKLRLLSEVFMQPAYDANGDPLGIKLDFVADDPLAKSYGIQHGDILETINGDPVTNSYQAENIYNNISSKTRRVQVGINRNGNRFNVWYEMDDFPATPDRNK